MRPFILFISAVIAIIYGINESITEDFVNNTKNVFSKELLSAMFENKPQIGIFSAYEACSSTAKASR